MERSEASVISARFIMCLAFAGLMEGAESVWTLPNKCRGLPCDKVTFDATVHNNCVLPFTQTMATTDYQLSCPWPTTRRCYVKLMVCLENLANNTCCMHASYRHHVLMEIHKVYFSLCLYMKDPGVPILLLLIVPCSIVPLIIPFLCQCFKSSLSIDCHTTTNDQIQNG
ncbi:uncharacterized protein LOC143723360 [Siphateles boraxobius]|uniref:uncharacterized protein LOC143723360 n=1 Tax=Siphateles boraxobius TaxID=180520 RepID=UPI004063EC58